LAFHDVLTVLGLKRTTADAGIYVRPQHGEMGSLIAIVYVDNITFLGSSLEDVEALKTALSKCFEMTDMGEVKSYLGINIHRDHPNKRLVIDQSRYLWGVLTHFSMADANPTPTPLPFGADVHLVKNPEQATATNIKLYQSMIGSLLYLQIGTHPDISFAVSRLAQYGTNPSAQHIRLAKYVLAYLVGTVDTKLVYDGLEGDGLRGFQPG